MLCIVAGVMVVDLLEMLCCCRCQGVLYIVAGANVVDLPDVLRVVAGVKVVNLPDVPCVVAGIRVVGRVVALGASG